jgi:hypothetical protein
MLGD